MSDLLRDSPDDLSQLCLAASDWFNTRGRRIPVAAVEKDYWVTEARRVLATPRTHEASTKEQKTVTARAVFKGGTSLSKAFRIIDRFSEDIDVYMVIEDAGTARADGILKTTTASVADSLGLTATPEP